MKINKGLILATIVGLVYATSSNVFTNVDAALTPPTSYDINYRQFNGKFRIGGSSGGTDILGYQRTADGVYYNYSNTFNNAENALIPLGLEITMTFNRSNIGNWNAVGTPPNVFYQPWDTNIGSDNTVGSLANKFYFEFDNQTNKDYRLFIDISSTASFGNYQLKYNGNLFINNTSDNFYTGTNATALMVFYLPAFTTLEFYRVTTTAATYLDGWYLKDLGVSDSYNEGFDDGFLDGYDDALTDGGIFGIFTAVFSSMASILSIELFAEITLGTVLLFPLMFGILFFILRVIRGQ
jgi:hypothetical protein